MPLGNFLDEVQQQIGIVSSDKELIGLVQANTFCEKLRIKRKRIGFRFVQQQNTILIGLNRHHVKDDALERF